jgi:hypothetical protein
MNAALIPGIALQQGPFHGPSGEQGNLPSVEGFTCFLNVDHLNYLQKINKFNNYGYTLNSDLLRRASKDFFFTECFKLHSDANHFACRTIISSILLSTTIPR